MRNVSGSLEASPRVDDISRNSAANSVREITSRPDAEEIPVEEYEQEKRRQSVQQQPPPESNDEDNYSEDQDQLEGSAAASENPGAVTQEQNLNQASRPLQTRQGGARRSSNTVNNNNSNH